MTFLVALLAATVFFFPALATPVHDRRASNLERELYALNTTSVDHFYTTNATELEDFVANDGYVTRGISAFGFPTQLGTIVPLYRMYSPNRVYHFYTVSEAARAIAASEYGYVYEGIQASVYPPTDQVCGSVAWLQAFNANSTVNSHFYTTNATEMEYDITRYGYAIQGIAAFVLPP